MRFRFYRFLLLIAVAMGLMACDEISTMGNSRVAVLDLAAIAKATGEDLVIKQKVEVTNKNLGEQLVEHKNNLDKRIKAEQQTLGDTPSKEQEQALQILVNKANNELQQQQAGAQQQLRQLEVSLVNQLRERVKKIASSIAQKKGFQMVSITSPSVLWFDASLDITDEVIAQLRANPDLLRDVAGSRKVTPEEVTSE